MKRPPKKAIPLAITVLPSTIEEMDSLIDAKLYKNKSQLIREAVSFVHVKDQLNALITDFVQIPQPYPYLEFFKKVKELMNHV